MAERKFKTTKELFEASGIKNLPDMNYAELKDVEWSPEKNSGNLTWSEIGDERRKRQKEETQEESSLLDAIIENAKLSLPAFGFATSPISQLFAGSLAEMGGNALQAVGDPDRTLAAKYNPALQNLKTVGDNLQTTADSLLKEGVAQVKPSDSDSFIGALENAVGSGFYGVGAGDTAMLHADKSASAFSQAMQKLADEEHVPLSFSADYFLNPHGMTSDFGQVIGSMLGIAPSMLAVPESAAARLGGNALVRYLINQGRYDAAKKIAHNAPEIVRYALGSAPAEAFAEGGHTRTEALQQGLSEDEATRRSINTALENIPLLTASNLLEGALLGAPAFNAGKNIARRAAEGLARGGINAGVQGTEEALQKAISNANTDNPYGILPQNWTPDQVEEFQRAFGGTLPIAGLAAGGHAISRPNENTENWKKGSQENISNEDYAKRADLSAKQAEIWDAAQYASARAKEKFGYDIKPELIYKQWAHEAGVNFDSENARYNNNFGGLTQSEPNGEENKQPDGNNYYRHFNNVREYADAYVDDFIKHYPEISGVKNEREFANVLKKYGYFGDSVENYASSMEGIAAPSPRTDSEIIYLGDKGKGEGQYWAKQNGNVSLEGLQPQGLNALDVLGKWFYDRTGKPLIVTAGTNGEHAGGEHSHAAGWKIDVNDWDGVSDGYLVTADGSKGTLTDEFIKYGQSLGLGMNWEGDHIDIALDGTQWDGSTETTNFGGFNPRKTIQDKKRQQKTTPAQSPQQSQTTKPLIDTDSENLIGVYEEFASEKLINTVKINDDDAFNFFDGMFNDKGEFQNTADNRNAIRENFSDEFSTFAEMKLPQQQISQANDTQEQSPLAHKPIVIETADKFLEQLRAEANPQKAKTLLSLQRARNDGNVAELENILNQNGIAISSPKSNQQNQSQPPQEDSTLAEILQARKARAERENKAMAIANNLMNISEADESFVGRESPKRSRIQSEPWEDLRELSRNHDITGTAYEKDLRQRQAEEEQQRQWKAKQDKELAELKARQAETKRLAEVRRKMNEETIAQRAAGKKQQLLENIQSILSNQDTALRNQITFALSEPSTNKLEREKQGNAILDLLERPAIKYAIRDNRIINSLKPSLKVGGKPAILKAQEILNELEAPEQRENRPVGKIRQTKSPIQLEQERRQREQKKQQRQWELAQRQEEENQRLQKIIERADFDDELQFEDEMQESKLWRQGDLDYTFELAGRDEDRRAAKERADNQAQDRRQRELWETELADEEEEVIGNLDNARDQRYLEEEEDENTEWAQQERQRTQNLFDTRKPNKLNNVAEEMPQPQKATKQKRKSKQQQIKDKLYEKLKVDTHPFIKIHLDWLFEDAANSGNKTSRDMAVKILNTYQTNNVTDEMLDNFEENRRNAFSEEDQRRILGEETQSQEVSKPAPEIKQEQSEQPKQSSKFIATDANGFDVHEGDPILVEHDFKTDGAYWRPHERAATFKDLDKIQSGLALYDVANGTPKIRRNFPTQAQEVNETTPKIEETPPQSVKKGLYGYATIARSGTRKKYEFQYKVVEADDLITSHKSDGLGVVKNDAFPQELQPRNRESVAMQYQPQTIGANLDPDELIDSPYINLGAPVVRNDGVVLNGNGRTLAIRYAYNNAKEKGAEYKNTLIQNAERLGLNGEEISKMKNPVLVRETPFNLSEEETQDVIGAQTGGAQMSFTEKAKTDVDKIKASDFNSMPEDNIVNADTASGRGFLTNILSRLANQDEINLYSNEEGQVNIDGVERAQRALYSIAYGDSTLLRQMADSRDDEIPKVTAALKDAAPLIAKIKKYGEEGQLHQYDLNAIPEAVRTFNGLKKREKAVEDYLKEGTLDGMAISPEAREILSVMDKNKKSAQTMADFFMGIAKGIEEQGDPRGEDLFGNKPEPKPLIDLIQRAAAQADELAEERKNKGKQKSEISLWSRVGDGDVTIKNFVDTENLTPQQKLLQDFGRKLGARTEFFDNENSNFHGAYSNGVSYLNVNSNMPLGKVFWHESMHWLKANNPKLYQQLVKAAGITTDQRQAYLKHTRRNDLKTDAAIDEDIIADQFEDVAKRSGLLQSISGKNRGLIQRVIQWLKDTMNKFIEHFRNPQGKFTTAQAQALADEFGRIANELTDSSGEKIFRYNRRTRNVELADGRDWNSIETEHSDNRGAFKFTERPRIHFRTEHALNFSVQERIKAQENSGTTQVSGTKTMYVKALQHLRNLKSDIKTVLDYGAGLGLGTDAMRENNPDLKIDSYEPNPQRWQGKTSPTFTDNTKIQSQYDAILNTNVLNVVEPEIRNAIVRDIGSLLEVGGKAMITTRSWKGDIEKTKNYTLGDEPHSVWITKSVDGKPVRVYQKGFDGNELLDYVSDLLGKDFKAEKVNGFGKSGVIVTRIANSVDDASEIKYSFAGNSDESTLQRIRNKISAIFSGDKELSERRNKRIVQRLARFTGYKIAFNHAGVDETIVDDLHKVIRGKHAYDWENLLPKVSEKIAHELKLPAQKEMANYITDWILTGALNNTSPSATAFQKAMQDNPAKAEALITIRDEFKEITEMSPEERYKMKLVRPKDSLMEKIMSKFTKEEWIDDLAPLQKLYDRIAEELPDLADELKKGINPVEMARLYRGKGGLVSTLMIYGKSENLDKIKAALQEQYPNVNFKYFKSLDMILEEAGGQKNLDNFEVFAVAKLDKEIFEWNRENPDEQYTPTNRNEADADAVIAKYEKQFGQAHKDLVSFSRMLLDIQYDAGLLTTTQYYKIKNKWKNYIPMARVFDENEDYSFAKSLEGKKTGSERDFYSPMMKIGSNAHNFIKAAERNKIKLELAGLARMGAFAEYIEERDTNKVNVKNHITFYENGKKKYLQTDPAVVRAIEALGGRNESVAVVKLLHAATKFMTAMYTSLNVDFAAGNVFRDLADSFLHNKYAGKNPLPLVANAGLTLWQGLTGNLMQDPDFIDWVANGGSQSTLVSPDIDYAKRDVESLAMTTKERFMKNPFSTILGGLQKVAEYSEYVTRIANYRKAKSELANRRADGKATVEDKRRAALVSREASIDFAKSGRSTRVANRVFAFTNAAVQSWYLDYQRFADPAKWKTAEGRKEIWSNVIKLGMSAAIPAIIQFALCHDKDWWKEKKDWEKETYWFFGDALKIPKGMDVSIRLTSALTDTLLSSWLDKEPVEAKKFLTTVKNALPSLTTTIATPLVEVALNKSWFRQAPIVPATEQHLEARAQYGNETSPVAKFFGEKIGFSPRKIDYLISGYFGFLGKFLTGGSSEYPIIRRFLNEPYKNAKSIQRYYELYEEQDAIYQTYQLERSQGKNVKLPKEFDPALYRRIKNSQNQMRKLSDLCKRIIDNPKLSADKRKEKLHEVEQRRLELCRKVLDGAR